MEIAMLALFRTERQFSSLHSCLKPSLCIEGSVTVNQYENIEEKSRKRKTGKTVLIFD